MEEVTQETLRQIKQEISEMSPEQVHDEINEIITRRNLSEQTTEDLQLLAQCHAEAEKENYQEYLGKGPEEELTMVCGIDNDAVVGYLQFSWLEAQQHSESEGMSIEKMSAEQLFKTSVIYGMEIGYRFRGHRHG